MYFTTTKRQGNKSNSTLLTQLNSFSICVHGHIFSLYHCNYYMNYFILYLNFFFLLHIYHNFPPVVVMVFMFLVAADYFIL